MTYKLTGTATGAGSMLLTAALAAVAAGAMLAGFLSFCCVGR